MDITNRFEVRLSFAEYVICAAYHIQDGQQHVHQPKNIQSGFVIAGRRHHNVINSVAILTGQPIHTLGENEEGFLTSKNRFVGREEAASIALAAGQIDETVAYLFSEDLY